MSPQSWIAAEARAVPLADEAAKALKGLHARSKWKADDDLVFAHPVTGGVMAKSNISRRMRAALKAAGLVRRTASTTYGIRSARAQRQPVCRCGRCRSGWATTTLIYADYSPGGHETELIERAFRRGSSRRR